VEDKLKRYEIVEFLGEGQCVTVYKARDSVNCTIVAVKKIKMGSRAETQDEREIKLLQYLKHFIIINLMDVFRHKSNISLVFD